MVRTNSTNSKNIEIFNTVVSFQDPVDNITLEKISAFSFVPRTKENEKKPLYLAVTTCGTKETTTRFYQFPKFEKEKFSVKTEGS